MLQRLKKAFGDVPIPYLDEAELRPEKFVAGKTQHLDVFEANLLHALTPVKVGYPVVLPEGSGVNGHRGWHSVGGLPLKRQEQGKGCQEGDWKPHRRSCFRRKLAAGTCRWQWPLSKTQAAKVPSSVLPYILP